jgi:hypothetical protein
LATVQNPFAHEDGDVLEGLGGKRMRGPCRKNNYTLINAQNNMDYEASTLLELKKLCKQRGLKISGTKDEVVIKLMEYDEMAA